MKKTILMCAVTLLFAASAATADTLPMTIYYPANQSDLNHSYLIAAQVQLTWPDGQWNGGPFSVALAPAGQLIPGLSQGTLAPVATPFMTFCVEDSIDFYTGVTYGASIDDVAAQGGKSGDPLATNALTPGAAWIYYQYRQDNLSMYSDQQISQAIWYEMGLSTTVNPTDSSDVAADNAVAQLADAAHPTGTGGVEVLNLWALQKVGDTWIATDAQSQLILVSDLPPSVEVPAPAAILLGLIGLSALGVYMRRYA